MPEFNFDFVIIIVLLFSIIRGYNRGLFNQLSSTVSIAIPLIVIQIWGTKFQEIASNVAIFNSISDFFYNFLKTLIFVDAEYVKKIILYLVIFLIMYLIIKIIFKFVSPSKKTKLLSKPSNYSKFIGSGLGLIAAYFIIVIAFILIKPVTNIDEDKPITGIVIESNVILKNVIQIPEELE